MISASPRNSLRPILATAAVSTLILLLVTGLGRSLYLVISDDLYLPIHSLLEMGSVVVSFSVFAVYWNAPREARSPQALFVGMAFLAVAIIDAMHLLSFPGMPSFVTPSTVEKGIYYWLAARSWATLALLGAAFIDFDSSKPLLQRWPLALFNLGVAALVFVAVSYFSRYLPAMFVPGEGLTPLKIGLEYLLIALSLLGALAYSRTYRESSNPFHRLVAMALVISAFSEMYFTLYAAANDSYNLLGHLFKVLAYYLIFSALFASAVRRPYGQLQAALGELDSKNRELEGLYDQIEHQLKGTITELKRTATLSQQRAEQLNALLESLAEGVMVLDARGRLVLMNEAARAITGMSDEQAQTALADPNGRAFEVGDQPVPYDDWPVNRVLRGDRFTNEEIGLVRPDGTLRELIVSGSAIRSEGGDTLLGMVIFRDVTEQYRLERSREEYVSLISHDLRAPLTVILGQAQMITRGIDRRELVLHSAEAIATSARRMNAMIHDLVDTSRLESGHLELHRVPVDLAPFLLGLKDRLSAAMDVDRVRVDLPADLPPVLADPDRLERILTNLLTNSLKYSSHLSEVVVTGERAGDGVMVSVADRGMGIAPEELPRIFERFYRVRGLSSHTEGTGLGLYITRMLVEGHGGRIWAESKVGEGSTFRFTLPVG